MTQNKPWNVTRIAMWGALAGVVYGLATAFTKIPSPPAEYLVGTVIGGAVGGAVVFGLVAVIRNLAGRSSRS